MGFDYIRRKTDIFQRKWDRSQGQLRDQTSIFDTQPEKRNLIAVNAIVPNKFAEKAVYELCVKGKSIEVYLENQCIGICNSPTSSILEEMIEVGGMAEGRYSGRREPSGIIDIDVGL